MKYFILFLCLFFATPALALELHEVSDEVVIGCETQEQKVLALQKYVFDNVKPGQGYEPNDVAKMSNKERLEKGVGWCNHQVDVFMSLARLQDIRTRMLYLLTADMHSSPHTIAEAFINNRWVITDVSWNLILRNPQGKLATRQDLADDFTILTDNPQVKEIAKDFPPFADEEYLRIYTNQSYLVKVSNP